MSLNLDPAGGLSAQSRNHLWRKRRNVRQKDHREFMQRGQKKVSRSTLPIGWMWQFLLAICKGMSGTHIRLCSYQLPYATFSDDRISPAMGLGTRNIYWAQRSDRKEQRWCRWVNRSDVCSTLSSMFLDFQVLYFSVSSFFECGSTIEQCGYQSWVMCICRSLQLHPQEMDVWLDRRRRDSTAEVRPSGTFRLLPHLQIS